MSAGSDTKLADLSGTRIGQYTVLEELGRGGISVVYRARHEVLEKDVAIKLLRPELTELPLPTQLLLEGARLLASLQHPSLVSVFDASSTDDLIYLVMEFVSGVGSDSLVTPARPLPPARALRIARDLADALAYAHDEGVLHRDVKPRNIIIGRGNRPVLVGFDLATKEEAPSSEIFPMFADPHFLPPEAVRGEPTLRKADVWGLGASLFFLLTGRPPVPGTDPALVSAKIANLRSAPSVRDAGPDVPARVADLVEGLLSPDPNDRPEDMAIIQGELDRVLFDLLVRDQTAVVGADAGGALPKLGERGLSRYRIMEAIGSGAYAVVYKAIQREDDALVALKVLKTEFTRRPEVVERFRREAEITKRAEHPAIVDVYDVGEDGRTPFFSMRYLEGGSLATVIEGGILAPADAVRIARTVADALAAAHEAGIVHRDLKPHNILLDRDGAPFLTDFGIAQISSLTPITRSGEILGTFRYMSPEHCDGEPPGPASDLYSLGVILFEMLTGTTPHEATTPATLVRSIIEQPAPPVRSQREDVPPSLAAIVDRLLQIDPEQRYRDARTLVADLDAWLA